MFYFQFTYTFLRTNKTSQKSFLIQKKKKNHSISFKLSLFTIFLRGLRPSNMPNILIRLIRKFKHMFSVFKQHSTYLYTFFHLYVFKKKKYWKLLLKHTYQTSLTLSLKNKEWKFSFMLIGWISKMKWRFWDVSSQHSGVYCKSSQRTLLQFFRPLWAVASYNNLRLDSDIKWKTYTNQSLGPFANVILIKLFVFFKNTCGWKSV